MKKFILFLLLILLVSVGKVFAQINEDNFDLDVPDTLVNGSDYFSEDAIKIDALNLDSNAVAFYDWYFSHSTVIYNFTKAPCQNLYQLWDTVFVHPYGFNLLKNLDTATITLVDGKSKYVHPRKSYVTSGFGYRWRQLHAGMDIKLNIGDSVVSAFDGMVRVTKHGVGRKSYGNVIVIRHFNGLETVYGHLYASNVKTNQVVKAGELIGFGGNTGHSTGPHLHFEVRYLGQPINPTELIDFTNYKLISDKYLFKKQIYKAAGKQKKAKYYKARKGDTVYTIAKKFRTSANSICELNGISAKTALKIGKFIRYR